MVEEGARTYVRQTVASFHMPCDIGACLHTLALAHCYFPPPPHTCFYYKHTTLVLARLLVRCDHAARAPQTRLIEDRGRRKPAGIGRDIIQSEKKMMD